mmetsp:Transcript_3554/g.7922  ORF Transcript_3554/g.7922 Transcript_3554/m.7922 type:complete len:91 (-) Transcript_3554:397-669(-)
MGRRPQRTSFLTLGWFKPRKIKKSSLRDKWSLCPTESRNFRHSGKEEHYLYHHLSKCPTSKTPEKALLADNQREAPNSQSASITRSSLFQ